MSHKDLPWVKGKCPACDSSDTLFVGEGGFLTCSLIGCPNPTAPAELLKSPMLEQSVGDPQTVKKHAATVLKTAEDVIHGDRLKHYGHPSINFERIARSWEQYKGTEITPMDVCVMMILLKAQRMAEGYHRDSVVDIGGYAALAAIVSGDEEL